MNSVVLAENEQQFQEEARAFARALTAQGGHATLVTLSGDLGAGKTTFTQTLAATLGVEEAVTSPTFVLAKSYALPEGGVFDTLLHIDAYRLEGERAQATIGFDEAYTNPRTLIVLEWPEMIGGTLPQSDIHITITVDPETEARTIAYA